VTDLSTALALLASAFLGTAVVIANVGLRYLDPARGALVSIPSTTTLFWLLALFLFHGEGWNATAFATFAVVGLIFPALVVLRDRNRPGHRDLRRIVQSIGGVYYHRADIVAVKPARLGEFFRIDGNLFRQRLA